MAAVDVKALEDAELYRRAKGGAACSWLELAARATKRLVRAVKRRFPQLEPWESEEIAADALVKTGLQMERFDIWQQAYGYARAIALHQALRWSLRARLKRRSAPPLVPYRAPPEPEDSHAQEDIGALDVEDFVTELARGLPANQLRVLKGVLAGHTTAAALSRLLGVSERTARRLLARLRERFRERWTQIQPD